MERSDETAPVLYRSPPSTRQLVVQGLQVVAWSIMTLTALLLLVKHTAHLYGSWSLLKAECRRKVKHGR